MKNNIIKLSEKYLIVLLPMDAKKIYISEESLFYEYASTWDLVELPENQEYKIIGTLDTLTEDQARDIIEAHPGYGTLYYADTFLEDLNELVKDSGIQTENPLKKPEDFVYCLSEIEIDDRCKTQCETCKEHNSEIKIVIIKTKA